jgi:flagellar motor protein MotB
MLEHDGDIESTSPAWISFADLMTGLLGAFVLLLVGVMAAQLDMASQLEVEVQKRQIEEQKRLSLENALAIPLASGRITLNNGRIGISGKLLFKLNSDQLEPEGRQLLKSLVLPLRSYLQTRDEMLMVSGFTDDKAITSRNREFADNWELSAQRALTVTRTLIEEGMPASMLFAAAFGQEQALVPNTSEQARAQNRRVEMAPVPKASNTAAAAPAAKAARQIPGTAPHTAPHTAPRTAP